MSNKKDNLVESLLGIEVAMVEQKSGLAITTMEDNNFPKAKLIMALAWVIAKRDEPTLKWEEFFANTTLAQAQAIMGDGDDEDEEGDEGK